MARHRVRSRGPSLTLVLHSHLPWVLHHGRWPHGSDWLCEAVVECYLPLARAFEHRARDGRSLGVTLGLTPVLCEQLAHPGLVAELQHYLEIHVEAARSDRARFRSEDRGADAALAARWERFYRAATDDLCAPGRPGVLARFRALETRGAIELASSAATHAYLPLLGTPLAVERQLALGRAAHHRHFGRMPRALWLPECAYRPAGPWVSPVESHRHEPWRTGIEQVAETLGYRAFFVDRHLIAGGQPLNVYAGHDDPTHLAGTAAPVWRDTGIEPHGPFVVGRSQVACFARDAATAEQVWSREGGYPGDPEYLDFHRRHHPGGLRYWAVTDARADLSAKARYRPEAAARRVPEHAAHFLDAVGSAASAAAAAGSPPHVCATYDTELFGHWWHEGPAFVAAVLDGAREHGVEMLTATEAVARHGASRRLELPEGSWGAGGQHDIWLQPDTVAIWRAVHHAERRFEHVAKRAATRAPSRWLDRVMAQACRSLLLLESSDWPFLVTTGAARDYAEARLAGHAADAARLLGLAERAFAGRAAEGEDALFLEACRSRDALFTDLDWREAAGLPESAAVSG